MLKIAIAKGRTVNVFGKRTPVSIAAYRRRTRNENLAKYLSNGFAQNGFELVGRSSPEIRQVNLVMQSVS